MKKASLPKGTALFSLNCFCLQAAISVAETYYIDSGEGSDASAGASPGLAWATLNKVNNRTFGPGDRILRQRGDSFNGKIFLSGTVSGSQANPLIIGANGTGDLKIHGDGGPLVNGAPNNKRYGVLIDASGTGRFP